MIKLSSLLEHILDHPMKGEAIQEAKRLEDNESDPLVCMEFTHEYEDTEGESVLWVIEITRDSDPFDSFGTIEFNDREEAKKALSMLRAACPEHHVSMFYLLGKGITNHPDPDVSNTELKPLLGEYTQNPLYILLTDHGGSFLDYSSDPVKVQEWLDDGRNIVQVMQPDTNGNCPTQCVYTPERPHEWVVYSPLRDEHYHWLGTRYAMGKVVEWWYAGTSFREVTRFATSIEAQTYIDTKGIKDAYPWAIPKLSEK